MATIRPRLEQNLHHANLWVRHNCNTAYAKLYEAMKSKGLERKLQSLNLALEDANIDPQHLLYGFFAFLAFWWAVSAGVRRLKSRKQVTRPRTPDLEKRSPFKAPAREPGGTLPNPYPFSLPDNLTPRSMDTHGLQASPGFPIPRLVTHQHEAPPLPALPLRPQIQHHSRPAQHALGRLDRARQRLHEVPCGQSASHCRARFKVLPHCAGSLRRRGGAPRGAVRLPPPAVSELIPDHRRGYREPSHGRDLRHCGATAERRPHGHGRAPRPGRPRHHVREARRAVLPPRGRDPTRGLLAAVGQVRDAAQ
jgi:hypothetical protein